MRFYIVIIAAVLAGLLALAGTSSSAMAAEQIWYLHGEDLPLATMSPVAPTAPALTNNDPGRDDALGLLVAKGGAGMAETNPVKYQQWVTAPGTVTLDRSAGLVFWAAMKNFATPRRGIVEAYLMDCEPSGGGCVEIAHGTRDIQDWSNGLGFWSKHSIDFGLVSHTIAADRSLAVRIVVGANSDDDMMFAYDTAGFPSHLTGNARGDIGIDCDFSDWGNGEGTEFILADQGGPDDYRSPTRLDLTQVAVATNLVDALQFLIAFDDIPVAGGTAGTLFDTNLDGNVNFALVASVDDAEVVLELYACDDSMTEGCGSAGLLRTYDDTSYCAGTGMGPWNNDTLIEADIPFADLATGGSPMFITSLISYAAASLLTSPKDSVFGTGDENYQASIYFDPLQGFAQIVGSVGTGFTVRRSGDPATVRTAVDHATTTISPYDDLPGTLDDGEIYFYVVDKTGGMPVPLSADSNRYDSAIRLGFDDENGLSAAVDPLASQAALDRTSVTADGTSYATLTITPRDSHGVAIGAGCDIEFSSIALSPGAAAAPLKDNRDGAYTLLIAATGPGTGQLVVTVEGITLTDRPTVTFTNP
ncbi:MAG: hypothetical protein IFK94_05560 [Acidobacteria bacterium]|uniref:Invasin domain-containing protein n=1 Tax=Candidatus Polarisedimenticola svalbardensis TaxID=2886004 RepID=A0A8J7CKT6_9BACT|nr:hypothetical protein [Candidatus Polarisedimenticola svalbardensis]